MKNRVVILIIVVALFTLGISACRKEQPPTNANVNANSTPTGPDSAQQRALDSLDKTKPVLPDLASAKGQALDRSFPDDVPLYPDSELTLQRNVSGNLALNFLAPGKQEDVKKFYEEKLRANDWKVEVKEVESDSTSNSNPKETQEKLKSYKIDARKDNRITTIVLNVNGLNYTNVLMRVAKAR
ncbi:MAG: hypothetical protein AB1489_28025 [Acidobacteriota bacterium]